MVIARLDATCVVHLSKKAIDDVFEPCGKSPILDIKIGQEPRDSLCNTPITYDRFVAERIVYEKVLFGSEPMIKEVPQTNISEWLRDCVRAFGGKYGVTLEIPP